MHKWKRDNILFALWDLCRIKKLETNLIIPGRDGCLLWGFSAKNEYSNSKLVKMCKIRILIELVTEEEHYIDKHW